MLQTDRDRWQLRYLKIISDNEFNLILIIWLLIVELNLNWIIFINYNSSYLGFEIYFILKLEFFKKFRNLKNSMNNINII